MIMIIEGKTLLRITDVSSWPREFKKGDRITTSFKLENKGTISAQNVKVVLFINGKEKNKVEVTIPSGGFADIKIPWIAIKGKNELHKSLSEKFQDIESKLKDETDDRIFTSSLSNASTKRAISTV